MTSPYKGRATSRWLVIAALLSALAVAAAACSDDQRPGATGTSTGTSASPGGSTAATAGSGLGRVSDRVPTSPPAALEGPITTGTISAPADPHPLDLAAAGYTQEGCFASGRATAYAADGAQGTDGRWKVTPTTSAPYKTRLVVRRPTDPGRFDGTVVVEWMNETGGSDAAPDWGYYGPELVREGAVWVGLSAQALGVDGGAGLLPTGTPNPGLKGADPARYGSLAHPGDQYSYDILSQVGAALRANGDVPVLGDLTASRLVASGESQSAFYLTTYIDAVQPVANVFDAFFVHSRGGTAAPLDGSGITSGAGVAGARIRTDLDASVLLLETETDVGPVLDYTPALQDDTDRIRVWEVAGTAHADRYLVGSLADSLGCPGLINAGPHHYVADAAFAALNHWVSAASPPPAAARIDTVAGSAPATVARDAHGIATGGIRTPSVDVPVATLSGDPAPGASALCTLFGTTTPFDAATVKALYPTRDAYLSAFDQSLDAAVSAGYVVPADRDTYAAEARAFPFPS